jgi:predicted HTH transcriptional regulator
MIPVDVETVVAQLRASGTDTRTVEVKSAAGGLPKTLASSVCAFANLPGGGTIILGLDESQGFSVVDLTNPRALADGVVSMARQALSPPVQLSVEEVESKERCLSSLRSLKSPSRRNHAGLRVAGRRSFDLVMATTSSHR